MSSRPDLAPAGLLPPESVRKTLLVGKKKKKKTNKGQEKYFGESLDGRCGTRSRGEVDRSDVVRRLHVRVRAGREQKLNDFWPVCGQVEGSVAVVIGFIHRGLALLTTKSQSSSRKHTSHW